MVCHAPVNKGPLGTLFVESQRHVLDFADFTDREAAGFGSLIRKIYRALKSRISPARIYQVSMMEGLPHFHAWLVPRAVDRPERGVAFLSLDLTCRDEEARDLAATLRQELRTA
jgi:diadenosine tetraphosphate (Ap4A) HIT family hydrolase